MESYHCVRIDKGMLDQLIFSNHETASVFKKHYLFMILFSTHGMKKKFLTKKLYCFLKDDENSNLNKIDNVVDLFG